MEEKLKTETFGEEDMENFEEDLFDDDKSSQEALYLQNPLRAIWTKLKEIEEKLDYDMQDSDMGDDEDVN